MFIQIQIKKQLEFFFKSMNLQAKHLLINEVDLCKNYSNEKIFKL